MNNKADEYDAIASNAARRAERLTVAVLMGTRSAADVAEDLALARCERDVYRAAAALRRWRDGGQVWVWPSKAPWWGFG